jgi:L-erythro-3,5-diaminohexanoate dehydrogenase
MNLEACMSKHGDRFGMHRVIEPKGVLTQAAWRVDNDLTDPYDNEILCDVDVLNVDSASFTQIKAAAGGDPHKIAATILETVGTRGKQHNPVTGSGGMFIGRVNRVGEALAGKVDLKPGDRIASLVSLSLTPLRIERVKAVHVDREQVEIVGQAVLFESGIWARLPEDLPEKVALAALDVAGAAAQTARLVKPGDVVFIIGAGGKSGMLCAYEARKRAGVNGLVVGTGHSEKSTQRIRELGFCDQVIQVNATNPVETRERFLAASGGRQANVTINCVNIESTEMASILCTRDDGTVYFFSMATSFTRAALGAEGIGSDVTMLIGNGYTRGHAAFTLQLLRESPLLRKTFEELYS